MGLRLDTMKLQQIDRQQNDMENNDRINVREPTVKNEQKIACESHHAKIYDRVHAKARQNGGGSSEAKQI
jgi:hypothetical protein